MVFVRLIVELVVQGIVSVNYASGCFADWKYEAKTD